MDGISGGIATWQTAETVIKIGEFLVDKYRAYREANVRINDLILRIEGLWLKTTLQMSLILELQQSLSARLQAFQEECFRRLHEHLQVALAKFAHLSGQPLSDGIDVASLTLQISPAKKIRYALLEKQLRQLVSDLESWHTIFDPSWYLLARLQHDNVDSVLKQAAEKTAGDSLSVIQKIRDLVQDRSAKVTASSFLDPSVISKPRELLPPTQIQLSAIGSDEQKVLLDTTTYPEEADVRRTIKFVRALSSFLSDPEVLSLSLLRCTGVIPQDDGRNGQFQYVFALPLSPSPPRSLRVALADASPSLDARFRLALCLAKALTSLHAANFVHKNVRPETIVVVEEPASGPMAAYLVGFENLRLSEAHSSLVSDMAWERNIYRHPSRQGLRPQEYYIMQHDIYSLGVCLLEIGLWTTFVAYTENLHPSPSIPISELLDQRNKRRAADEIKGLLISMAKGRLPGRMGKTYTDVVVDCLTCLDKEDSNPLGNSPDLLDEDGIAIGIAFIENILMRLESISL